jgi:hypothetical protein
LKVIEKSKKSKGRFGLIYSSEPGAGKSTSCIASLPEPVLCIYVEDRDPNTSLDAIDKNVDVTFVCPESQEEMMDTLYKIDKEIQAGEFKYKSIIFDSLSYWMNVALLTAMEDETYDAEIFKRRRDLVDRVRSDEAVYGGLASHMNRICKGLKVISQSGVTVICIAQGMESPKWNRDLSVAPHFIGQKFSRDLKSHFDLIGLVETRVNGEGEVIYPPLIRFSSTDGSFMAKWCGRPLKKSTGILDFNKILNNT